MLMNRENGYCKSLSSIVKQISDARMLSNAEESILIPFPLLLSGFAFKGLKSSAHSKSFTNVMLKIGSCFAVFIHH